MDSTPEQRGVSALIRLRHTITVDGSYGYAKRVAGVGLVIQETDRPGRRGPVVEEIAEAYVGVPTGDVESLAILRALEIGVARGLRVVRVRSDYNELRRNLRKHHRAQHGVDRDGLPGVILRLARGFEEAEPGRAFGRLWRPCYGSG